MTGLVLYQLCRKTKKYTRYNYLKKTLCVGLILKHRESVLTIFTGEFKNYQISEKQQFYQKVAK